MLSAPKYGDHFNVLVALIAHMAVGQWPHRSVSGLAQDTSITEGDILGTLKAFKGLFRESSTRTKQGEAQFALHLRYAKTRHGDHGEPASLDPLTQEDLSGLLGFVTERANQEALSSQASRMNWIAVGCAIVSAIAAIVAARVC